MGGGIPAQGDAPGEDDDEADHARDVVGEKRRIAEGGAQGGCLRGHHAPWAKDDHEAGPAGEEPAELAMPGDAVAEDQEDLRGEQQHPAGEDDGVHVKDAGRGRSFVEEAVEVHVEAEDHAEPQNAEPDGRGGAVVPRAPGSAYMLDRLGPW